MITPPDATYEDARQIWNAMIDRRPAAIVRAESTADVQATIAFAREQNLPLAVRGGGHSASGKGTCGEGIVLDMGPMRFVGVDPVRRTALAGGGALWQDVDRETGAFGLATPGGAVSTTGIGGLTLGGGFGYLSRLHGMVVDNLLSVDVVTAEGKLLKASSQQNQDLFWGLRGGGGNFGVATAFEYRLHAVPGVYGGLLVFPFTQAKKVLQRYRDVSMAGPEALNLNAGLLPMPDGGKAAGVVAFYNGDPVEGERLLRPLRELGPLMDTVEWKPYATMQQLLDANYRKGLRSYWKSSYLKSLDDELLDLLIARVAAAPAASHVLIEQSGGAVARVAADATAFEHRSAPYNLLILGLGIEPSHDETCISWARALWGETQKWSTGGTYVNYLSEGDAVPVAYSSQTMERLAVLKKKYDPDNLFRINANILPAK